MNNNQKKNNKNNRSINQSGVVKVTQNIPKKPSKFKWDCFLSHSWGKDNLTHKQVVTIGIKLEKAGLNVWIDERELSNDIVNQMMRGIDNSPAFIAFITKDYLQQSNDRDNNAGKEYNYAANLGVDRIICA